MNFLFLDLEYANFKNKSICEISLIIFKNSTRETITKKYLVNPNDTFDEGCIQMHGISEASIQDKPLFSEVWRKIEEYFINSIVVGHNVATSDLDGIYKNLTRYNIQMPEIYYICTYDLAKLLIPKYEVKDYSIHSLNYYYNIGIVNERDSLGKLYSYYQLSLIIMDHFKKNLEEHIKRFEPLSVKLSIDYHANIELKKDIHILYGVLEGFLLDEKIGLEEVNFLKKWKEKYKQYSSYKDIKEIIECIDEIIEDGEITIFEMEKLKDITKRFLDIITSSPITIATQILKGIIKGISIDENFNMEECVCLRNWLYKNSYLVGHYPFDKIYSCIEQVLHDGIITQEEERIILAETNKLLNPIEKLKQDVYSLEGKQIYLSGDFVFGTIDEVKEALNKQGYIVTNDKKQADLVFYGGYSEELLTDGEFLREGEDALCVDTPLNKILFSHIKKKGLTVTAAYKQSGMTKQMMNKLKWNKEYHPNKKNLCAFAVGLQMDLNETLSLLSSAGYTLSDELIFDRIIINAIKSKNYNIDKITEELYKYNIDWIYKR